MVQGSELLYGSIVVPHSERGPSRRNLFQRTAVAAIAIVLVVATVAWTQQADPAFVSLEGDVDGLVRSEKVGIYEAQKNLDSLEEKVKEESQVVSQHHNKEKREKILSLASKAKAAAATKTAEALLETVKEHTEEIAKVKDLKFSAEQRAIYKKEHAKVLALRKKAAQVKEDENNAIAKAKKETAEVESEQKVLKSLRDEVDQDQIAESNMKLLAKNEMSQAKAKEHIAELGIASSKTRRRAVEHLERKQRRLAERIRHIKNQQRRDKEAELSDRIAAKDYRRQGEAEEAKKERLKDEIQKLKMSVDRESRKAEELSSTLETDKEALHDKDDHLERAKSTEHEAHTALQRAKHVLRQAERKIYHDEMKDQADRHPSDADLGLV